VAFQQTFLFVIYCGFGLAWKEQRGNVWQEIAA